MSRSMPVTIPGGSRSTAVDAGTGGGSRKASHRRAGIIALGALMACLGVWLCCAAVERHSAGLERSVAGAPPARPRAASPPPATAADPYQVGYARGRAEAAEELAEGTASLYRFGFPGEQLDRGTGLPYEWVAGCMVDDQTCGRIDGHNDAIRERIAVSGLPAGSFKPWEGLLFDLRRHFAKPDEGGPQRLVPGGPGVTSPDGATTLRLRPVSKSHQAALRTAWTLGAAEPRGGAPRRLPCLPEGLRHLDVVWGPARSGLAFLRWEDEESGPAPRRWFGALDSRTGRLICTEVETGPGS